MFEKYAHRSSLDLLILIWLIFPFSHYYPQAHDFLNVPYIYGYVCQIYAKSSVIKYYSIMLTVHGVQNIDRDSRNDLELSWVDSSRNGGDIGS